jgi:hypothetical protein
MQLDLRPPTPAAGSDASDQAPDATGGFLNDSEVRPTVVQTPDQAPTDQVRPNVGPGSRPWSRGPRAREKLGDPRHRPDGSGFHRFRGQGRRGPPAAAKALDEHLAMACDELVAAREQLAAAYAMPTEEREERAARREAFKTALAKLALAGRFVDDVILRHGGTPPDCEPAP